MAARSEGLFPREGFNLDDQAEITSSPTAASVTLKHAKTIRIIAIGLTSGASDAVLTVTVGGEVVEIQEADLDPNGVGIAHIRGALCKSDNDVSYAIAGTTPAVGGVYYELVDGPRR